MTYVQMHERAWGDEMYLNRPGLEEILTSNVVAFWYPAKPKDERYTVSLHENLADIHQYISRMVLRSRIQMPDKRLARLFIHRQQVIIRGVKLVIEYPPDVSTVVRPRDRGDR